MILADYEKDRQGLFQACVAQGSATNHVPRYYRGFWRLEMPLFSFPKGSVMNFFSRQVPRFFRANYCTAISIIAVSALAFSSAASAVDNVQSRFAGAEAGDWGGPSGAAVGPPDGACANMGAVGKVNLVSGFGFDIPGGATITGVTVRAKAGENGPQSVNVQLATNATTTSPTTIGNVRQLSVLGTGGSCASTTFVSVGTSLASWGNPALTPGNVSTPQFGLVLVKTQQSSIKVDAVCVDIEYTTAAGEAVQENCTSAPPPEEGNTITVIKSVVGAPPGTDWGFTGELGSFSLGAGGGFEVFPELADDTYTITETTKDGYDVSVECLEGENVIVALTNSNTVNVPVSDDIAVTCFFTNTNMGIADLATFTVTKIFSDGNDAIVNVHLSCFGGSTLDQDKEIWDGQNVVFNLESPAEGTNCQVTEGTFPGYTAYYSGDCDAEGWIYDVIDEDYECDIYNQLDPVIATVYKDWVIEGEGGDAIDGDYKIKVICNAFIFDYDYDYGGKWFKKFHVYNDISDKAFTFGVLPDWDGGSDCWVDEEVYDSSVEVSSSCGHSEEYAGIHVDVNTGDDCTITNTVFYEGIPTLSQYGKAILALLMLGVGFVGFRRFV